MTIDIRLTNRTVSEVLAQNAHKYPDKIAAIYDDLDISYTWKELDILVSRIANGFKEIGVVKGDHIAIWATNIPEWYLTQLAAARVGCPLITINPEWKSGEVEYALRQSDAKVLVMSEGFTKRSRSGIRKYNYLDTIMDLLPELSESGRVGQLVSGKLPELEKVILVSGERRSGMFRWNDVISEEVEFQNEYIPSSDVCMIQYTSGTTGFPKGAMLTHYNVLNNATIGAYHMRLSDMDILCGPVPYYHCFGSILLNLVGLVTGATVVIPSETFDGEKTLKCIEQYHCTALHGVPTMFMDEVLIERSSHYNVSSLRTGIIAGAPVGHQLMKSIISELSATEMTIGYGLTEASPLTHQTDITDTFDRRVGSVGQPIHFTESKVMDPVGMRELGTDAIGEIWVKGFHVMKGYYKKPEETRNALVDGWLRTGDLGFRDKDGYYHISGRLKEMIIVGGHNVYPAEVESALGSLFKQSFEQVYAVGVPDPRLQEVVGIAVKFREGRQMSLEEIRAIALNHMEWPKVPRYLIEMDDFEKIMTVTGKIQKFKLRELFTPEIELSQNFVSHNS